MNFEITDRAEEKDSDTIYAGLLKYNLSKSEDKSRRSMASMIGTGKRCVRD